MIVLRQAELYAPERLGRQDLLIAGGTIVAMAPGSRIFRRHSR